MTSETLADFIVAEVARQSSETSVRALVEAKIGKIVEGAVDSALRSYGNVGKQIEAAVAASLEMKEPLDVPSYGAMMLAVLRQKMDEVLTPLVSDHLGKEMADILGIGAREVKLSDLVEMMKKGEDQGDRFGTSATLTMEEDERFAGWFVIHLDPEADVAQKDCEARISVTKDGKVYALRIDGKDPKTTIALGLYDKWQKTLFALYATGGKLIVDGDENDFDLSYGDY